VIEKALNHTIKGVRGVYNRAQLKQQRKRMLADCADMVEELTQSARRSAAMAPSAGDSLASSGNGEASGSH
jgi:hypothetical protein